MSNRTCFGSIFDADFENDYVLTEKGPFKLIVTIQLDAVHLYNQDEHVIVHVLIMSIFDRLMLFLGHCNSI